MNASKSKEEIPSSTSNNNDNKLTFQMKSWNFTAFWKWNVDTDTCAICRAEISDSCLKCQSEKTSDECIAVWGQCNHSFHNCCMIKWIQQSKRCPLCQQEWIKSKSQQIHHSDSLYSNCSD